MQGGQVFAPHLGSRSGGVGNILAPFGFALIPTSLNLSGYKFDKFNDFFICPALRTQVLNQAKNFAACHFVHFPFTCLFYIHGLRRVDLISRPTENGTRSIFGSLAGFGSAWLRCSVVLFHFRSPQNHKTTPHGREPLLFVEKRGTRVPTL